MKCTVNTTMQRTFVAVVGAILLTTAGTARAHEDPSGCFETGPAIIVSVFRANGTTGVVGSISECETINYRATLQKAQNVDSICAFSGGTFKLTLPNGNVVDINLNVPCIGGTAGEGCDPSVTQVQSALIPYTVSSGDIAGGFVVANATYAGGVAHDSPANTAGVGANTPKSTPVVRCSDNNLCTTDVCNPALQGAAACSNPPIVCNDNTVCTTDQCVEGQCVFTPISCDDNDVCTTDTCHPVNGCGHAPITCNDNDPCTTNSCNPTTGCFFTPGALNCNDNDPCTSDACVAGQGCVNTPGALNCNDNDPCTTDACVTGVGCQNTPGALNCNDNDACTSDACVPGQGCVNTPIICNDGSACTIDTCDPASGCKTTTISCDDNNACTIDACSAATGCSNTPINVPVVCNDNDVCTSDVCVPATGCQNNPGALNCNDNNACTTDTCDPVQGCKHQEKVCNDNDVCTDDSCNTQTGQCEFTPNPDNDPSCQPTICRTPGYWGTHGRVTQAVIDSAGGCLEVCGEVIKNVTVASADSALEAICTSPRGDSRLQLARQLTSMALNCVVSDRPTDCGSGTALGNLFSECNKACRGVASELSVGDCISAVDCFNNGGLVDESGLCGSDPSGSCHERALPSSLPLGSADTPKECNSARKNSCGTIPPYEQSTGVTGCSQPGNETAAGAETCN